MSSAEPLTQLGRYQLLRVIGRGAMGLVYEGRDPRLDRTVAVKTILKSHLLDEAMAGEYSARFVREAQAAGRLNHPNIVTVFDFGEEGDIAYLVMEFIRGRELAAHFEADDFFDLPQAVRIMGELLDALGYAHERGIVHRDVKPANVMIETGGRVKLTDFGVARLADANVDRTQPGTMVGTPSYMSPEQIQGLAVGSRTDLFAAGVVLYQFLTHHKPFTGGGQWTVQKKIVQDDPVAPSLANRAVPAAFDAIVRRALAKNPEQRYATAAEFAADLRRALDATEETTAPSMAPDPDATVVRPPWRPPAAPTPTPPTPPEPWKPAAPAPVARASTPKLVPTPVPVPAPAPSPRPSPASGPSQAPPPPRPAAVPVPTVAAPPAPAAAKARSAWWAAGAGVAVLALGLVAWRLMPGEPATVVEPAPYGAPVAAPPTTTATEAAPAPEPAAASVPAPSPAPVTVTVTVPVPVPVPTTVTAAPAASGLPSVAPATATALPAVDAPPPRSAPRAAAAAARPVPAVNARCSELAQRIQLGESLVGSDLETFQQECRR